MLLEKWQCLNDEMRRYDYKKYHAVNVKRYNDYVGIDKLLEKIDTKKWIKNELKSYFNDDEIDNSYYSFLEFSWYQLQYELSDIQDITEGGTDEHKQFQYFEKVYSMGRSGGWACFEMFNWDEVENDLNRIIDGKETEYFTLDEIEAMLEETEYIKEYIKNYNNGLSFEYFLTDQIEQKTDDIESEIDNKSIISQKIELNIENIDSILKRLSTDKILNDKIKRQTKSITAILKTLDTE